MSFGSISRVTEPVAAGDQRGRMVQPFDERQLVLLYQERKSDGSQRNFFRLDNPKREDA
ncbi:MAG: hypothetical protein M3R24_00860 [Chloroflexota bacterium]|nr:hypothetical protein [Chloroflexota bacterium]